MDSEIVINTQRKQVEKLNRIKKIIQKTGKTIKITEKKAGEFKEIQKLLQSNDDKLQNISKTDSLQGEPQPLDCNVILIKFPGVKVFHNKLLFTLFEDDYCLLKNLTEAEEEYAIFSSNKSFPPEECNRKLISHCAKENLLPEEGKSFSVSLYVLYLMSVHQDPNFVKTCFDFLKHHKFSLQLEDIFPIFSNFGAKSEDLFYYCKENILKKFPGDIEKDKNAKGILSSARLLFYNLEMVGRILLRCIGENLLLIDSYIKSFVRRLVKITLHSKIGSGSLLPLYSTVLTTLCSKIRKDFGSEEVLGWVHSGEDHLLNQLEISQSVSKPICTALRVGLVLRKILPEILRSKLLPAKPPFKKVASDKSNDRELPPFELYSLQIINGSLPGLTATTRHSTEINSLLACLEQKISKVRDFVDLMRLKLEISKVGNLVTKQ